MKLSADRERIARKVARMTRYDLTRIYENGDGENEHIPVVSGLSERMMMQEIQALPADDRHQYSICERRGNEILYTYTADEWIEEDDDGDRDVEAY